MSRDRLTELITDDQSFSKDAIVAATYADDYTIRGNHFLFDKRLAIVKNTTVYFLLDLSSVSEGKQVIVQPSSLKSESAKLVMKIYEDGDYSGGTVQDIFNVNRLSAITPEMVITQAPTGSDKGTHFRTHIAFAGGQGVNTTPGEISAINITVLDPSKNYLLEIINEDTVNDTDSEFVLSFFEI